MSRQVPPAARRTWVWLICCMAAQLGCYLWLFSLSSQFEYGKSFSSRPIPLVLLLLTVCFVLHLVSLFLALKIERFNGSRLHTSDRIPAGSSAATNSTETNSTETNSTETNSAKPAESDPTSLTSSTSRFLLLGTILLGACIFRLPCLLSNPIQEVDIYRYIWDGASLGQGVSPFRYNPQRVQTASLEEQGLTDELRRLIELRDRDQGVQAALSRVHYAELTTVYPPISQVVFATADWLTPSGSSLRVRLVIMKFVIVAFDLAVLALLANLLSRLGWGYGWLIIYGWSPLVIKEFANSGHLDSIAVFFATASLVVYVSAWLKSSYVEPTTGASDSQEASNSSVASTDGASKFRPEAVAQENSDLQAPGQSSWNWRVSLSALCLALGVGSKLYPIILLPLLTAHLFFRKGRGDAIRFGLIALGVSCLVLWPMLAALRTGTPDQFASTADDKAPPMPSFTDPDEADAVRPSVADSGLTTFLARWEMNDLIFMMIQENVRAAQPNSDDRMWFVVVPQSWRERILDLGTALGIAEDRVAFAVARFATLFLSGGVVLLLAWQSRHWTEPSELLRGAFLAIAWFWLLSPTQNPWYWTWALPYVIFARSRIWWALGGLVLIYYLRFWISYQFFDQDILGTGYVGTQFFDVVLVWLEFGPWFLALAAVTCLSWSKRLNVPDRPGLSKRAD